jgi:hypothetical protein
LIVRLAQDFPDPLVTSQMISASTTTTINTPTHTPALKIPPTTAQLLSNNEHDNNKRGKKRFMGFNL